MRKVYAAAALSAVAIVSVAAASGAAAQGPLKVSGKTSVFATPTNSVDEKGKTHTTAVEVTGKVKTRPACAGGRTITFTFVTPAGSYVQGVTAVTNRNGAFTASLPFTPTGLNSKSQGTDASLSAFATQVSRKDKQTGEKVRCIEASGLGDFTVFV
jgi:hypothetical protein